MRVPTGRTEKRTARAIAVELAPLDGLLPGEITVTKNVSPHGARVLTKKRWQPEERVLLKSARGGLRAQGRVVYCQQLPSNAFAIGLELFALTGEWGIPSNH